MRKVIARAPEIHLYHPLWYHHHGDKMAVSEFDLPEGILVIAGTAAKIIIRKASFLFPNLPGWFVDWEVVQIRPSEQGVKGRIRFDDEDLACAFGVSSDSGKFGDWVIKRYGAEAAEQGKYIRWQDFLNIPCPGTGHDGDPNVSVRIDEKMQDIVRHLLKN